MMKAVTFESPGAPSVLKLSQIDKPVPKSNEILIRVKAAGVNRADSVRRKGNYPLPPGANPILGVEASGIVDAVGDNVSQWKVGDRVAALLNGGGYAEWATAPESLAFELPKTMSDEQMAAIPEVFLTAFQLLCWLGQVKPNQTVLIHAGASGVGTAAIELCQVMDAQSIVTVGSEQKVAFCTKLGAKLAINRHESDFEKEVLEATNGQGADLILDCVGQSYWNQNLSALKRQGTLVQYGALSGTQVKEFSLGKMYQKWPTIIGTTLFPRDLEYKSRLVKDLMSFAQPHFESGKLFPIVHQCFDLEDVVKAHEMLEANENIGKIILKL